MIINLHSIMQMSSDILRSGVISMKWVGFECKLTVVTYIQLVERQFSSPMLNDSNLHFCGGWSWSRVGNESGITLYQK